MFLNSTKVKEVIMSISPVSFSSTVGTTSFQDKIRQPQAYLTKEQPAASSQIKQDGGKKKSPAKIIAGVVIAAGAALAGLGLGAKHGIFAPGKNATLNTVKGYMNKVGNAVIDYASKAKEFILSKLPKAAEKATDAAGAVVD